MTTTRSYLAPPTCALLALALWPAPLPADEPVQHFDPNIELPDSEGKAVVLRACTKCHELAGLSAYKGYWGREQWKEMVEGMVKNGAELVPADVEVVATYLDRHFGRE
ncbi:MAG TPA: cytochrome c [Hyphomicrobiales bacterium]|nr:cytochrome c [Hyphomicrobiales bacterium]